MDRSDWLLVAANAVLFLVAFSGVLLGGEDLLFATGILAMLATALNGAAFYRRRSREPATRRRARTDDLDARAVLDLDARLEALEVARADLEDAAKWRALVESGQVRGPAAEPGDAAGAGPRALSRNGL